MPENESFYKNVSMRSDIDPNGYLDVIAHGNKNKIQMFVNGQVMEVDSRVASRIISNSQSYNGQNIRLLSCNTGAVNNGFAQNLANKLNVTVSAPNNYLWAYPNGKMIVAGKLPNNLPDLGNIGNFIDFIPGNR